MAVGSFLIAIQASFHDGRPVERANLIDALQIDGNDPIEHAQVGRGIWQAGLVHFPSCHLSEFKGNSEPHEMLFAKLQKVQNLAVVFLDARETAIFGRMRQQGMEVRIFIDVRMNQDQMELPLSASFVAECGRHRLPVNVISNDISAAEVKAAGRRNNPPAIKQLIAWVLRFL